LAAAAAGDAHRRQAVTVEPRHQIGHGRSAAQAGLARRVDEHTGSYHCQQRGSPTYLVDTFAGTAGNTVQSHPFGAAQAPQGLSLWGRHLFPSGQVSGKRTPDPAISGMTH